MIRVGFIGAVSKEWMGGLNYYKNLLYALSILVNRQIVPIVFVGKQTDENIKKMFRQYAHVVEHSMFDYKSLTWYGWKILSRFFKFNYFLEKILKKYHIDILSHSDTVGLNHIKTINWIPDFQHIHLPEMFSSVELTKRNQEFLKLAKYSDAIILSSYDALKDFNNFAPQYIHKAKVLQFVSQPNKNYFDLNKEDEKRLRNKYQILTPFFYLPNQFWKHKNHLLVFEALKLLNDKGICITLVCTGHLHDYRNIQHIDVLKNYITKYNLENQIYLLGLVDYEDVFAFIKFSEAVINPSLFEGWSSTVEECKSVGKNIILSDLDVHKEQFQEAQFFERNNAQSLATLLENYQFDKQVPSAFLNTDERTRLFAETFQNIIKGL